MKNFCIGCQRFVPATIRSSIVKETVNGKRITYEKETAFCPLCDKPLFSAEVDRKNQLRARKAYG